VLGEELGPKLSWVSRTVFLWVVHGQKRSRDAPYLIHTLTQGSDEVLPRYLKPLSVALPDAPGAVDGAPACDADTGVATCQYVAPIDPCQAPAAQADGRMLTVGRLPPPDSRERLPRPRGCRGIHSSTFFFDVPQCPLPSSPARYSWHQHPRAPFRLPPLYRLSFTTVAKCNRAGSRFHRNVMGRRRVQRAEGGKVDEVNVVRRKRRQLAPPVAERPPSTNGAGVSRGRGSDQGCFAAGGNGQSHAGCIQSPPPSPGAAPRNGEDVPLSLSGDDASDNEGAELDVYTLPEDLLLGLADALVNEDQQAPVGVSPRSPANSMKAGEGHASVDGPTMDDGSSARVPLTAALPASGTLHPTTSSMDGGTLKAGVNSPFDRSPTVAPAPLATVAAHVNDPPPCTCIFRTVEDLYAYLLLRGQNNLTEDQYGMARNGFNIAFPVPLPSLTCVRYTLAPMVDTWSLRMETCKVRVPGQVSEVPVHYIFPSSHVRRDLRFARTFKKFLAADLRSDEERALHPEFVDSPFFQDRGTVLLAGKTVKRFVLDGMAVTVGNQLQMTLVDAGTTFWVVVSDVYFCSHSEGVGRDHVVHAGDFVIACDDADGAAGCIVVRHWLSELLHGFSWRPDPDHSLHKVKELCVSSNTGIHSHSRAARRPRRVVRAEEDGGLTVSVCVFLDDFEARKGKTQSLGGAHMSYPLWEYKYRCRSHALPR